MGKPRLMFAMTPENLSAVLEPDARQRLAQVADFDDLVVIDPCQPAAERARTTADSGNPTGSGQAEDPAFLAGALADVEVLFTCWGVPVLDEQALAAMPRLRAVVHAAGSVKGFATAAVRQRGITVSSAVAANAVPVAEYTVAMVLLAGKYAFPLASAYASGHGAGDEEASDGEASDGDASERLEWYQGMRGRFDPGGGAPGDTTREARPGDQTSDPTSDPISDPVSVARLGNRRRTVGVVGASRVGRLVLEALRPYGFRLLLSDPTLSDSEVEGLGACPVELDDLIRDSDVVSVHAPDLPSTYHLIDARRLGLLRPGATLINTARGRLVDTEALIGRLRSGDVYAVLDVTDPEPLPADSELFRMPNAIITPHIAGSLGTEVSRMGELAVDEVERYVRGEPFAHQVDLGRLDLLA